MSKILYKQDTKYSCTCLHLAACFDFSSPASSSAFHFFFSKTLKIPRLFSVVIVRFYYRTQAWHRPASDTFPVLSPRSDPLFLIFCLPKWSKYYKHFGTSLCNCNIKNNLITIKRTDRWWGSKRLRYTLYSELKYPFILWVVEYG